MCLMSHKRYWKLIDALPKWQEQEEGVAGEGVAWEGHLKCRVNGCTPYPPHTTQHARGDSIPDTFPNAGATNRQRGREGGKERDR